MGGGTFNFVEANVWIMNTISQPKNVLRDFIQKIRHLNNILLAGIASVVAAALVISIGVAAYSATGAVGSLSLTVLTDGTAPFDADDAAGNDSSATNGVLRTMDDITYRWDYSVATAGDITFVQQLPDNMRWDVSSTSSCTQGASAISADKTKITCTIANAAVGAGSYQVKAKVLTGANGTTINTSVVSGGTQSAAVSTTLSATPKLILEHMGGGPQRANGPASYSTVPGFNIPTGQNILMPIDATKGVKGLESFTDPITFRVKAPTSPTGAILSSCSAGPMDGSRQPWNNTNPTYTPPNHGTWTCEQDAPGTDVFVTVTGMDTSLSSWPTKFITDVAIPSSRAYVAAGKVTFWYPESALPDGSVYTIRTQADAFDPVSSSNTSNYSASYAGNQEPGAACTTNFPSNCATSTVNLRDIIMSNWVTTQIPDQTSGSTGDAPVYPGQAMSFQSQLVSGAFNPELKNVQQCFTFDNTKMTVPSFGQPISPNYTVEYGVLNIPTVEDQKSANCGTFGDGAPAWSSSSAAAPGGHTAVNAIRIKFNTSLTYNQSKHAALQFVRTTEELAIGTPLPLFMQYWADNLAVRKSNYNPDTHASYNFGNRGLSAEAKVRNTAVWSVSSTAPGSNREVTVTPQVTSPFSTDARNAKNVKVTVKMPSACETYQTGSASIAPASVTPANLGLDGVACTVDDVSGQVLVFDLGDVSTDATIDPITFNVNFAVTSPAPSTKTLSSVITSDSDIARMAVRTSSPSIIVNAVGEFAVSKQASVAKALNDEPFEYTIGWSNRLTANIGVAKIVDVLPFAGDSRGTTGIASMNVVSASATVSGVTFQYTTMDSSALEAAVANDPSGDTDIAWVTDMPVSGVTGVRIITPALGAGSIGAAVLTVKASGLTLGGELMNTLSAKAEQLATPVTSAALTRVETFASSVSGNVYHDVDYSWSKNTGDTNFAAQTVSYTGYKFGPNGIDDNGSGDDISVTTPVTTQTDVNGNYTFQSVDPGKFSFVVAAPNGFTPAQVPANPLDIPASVNVENVMFGFVTEIPVPIAVDDAATTGINSAQSVAVLTNDTVDDSASITAVSVGSNGGVITISSDGQTVIYTPAIGFTGTETFSYTVTDKARQSDTATVTMTVVAGPTAGNDFAVTKLDQSVVVGVLANDDGANIAVTSITQPATGGSVTLAPDGSVTFTPTAGFEGLATFTYTITDAVGQTATASVTVRVYPSLVAVNDQAITGITSAGERIPVTIPVTGNDTGYGFEVDSHTQAAFGNVTWDANGHAVYTPDGNGYGTDTFTYTIRDGAGNEATATVTVTVKAPPFVTDDAARIKQGTPVTIDVLANDDLTSPEVTRVSEMITGSGTAVVNPDGTVTFTPAPGFTGLAEFTYTAIDSFDEPLTATVRVEVVAAPVTNSIELTVLQGDSVTINVMNFVDAPATSTVSITGVTQPGQGAAAVVTTDGEVRYDATGNTGVTSFTYTVTDDLGQTSTGTVTVTVYKPLFAGNDSEFAPSGSTAEVDLFANDTGETYELDTHTDPANGSVTIANGVATYVPGDGFVGSDSFTYTIVDEFGQTSTATVFIEVLPELIVKDVIDETVKGQPIQLFFDLQPGVTIDSVDVADSGTVEIREDSTVWFSPAAGFVGEFQTTYTAQNQVGVTATASITVIVKDIVTPVDPPGVTPQQLSYTGSTAIIGTVTVLFAAAAVMFGTAAVLMGRTPKQAAQ